jgi:CRISPR/Cas system-associated exonuclease Cas4 (RecB family)
MTTDLIKKISEAVLSASSQWPLYGDEGSTLDRNAVLTASENLRCLRELKFSKTMPKAFDRWGMAQRGHAVEAWVVAQLAVTGETILLDGDNQRSFLDSMSGLSGTPDGVWMMDGNTPVLLEFKSVDPRTNLEGLSAPKPQHFAQIQQNMWLLQQNGIDVQQAVVLYIDASDFQRMKQFDVAYDGGEVASRAAIRSEILFDAETAAELPAEGLTNNGCTFCAYKEECSAIQVAKGEKRKSERPDALPDFAPRGITESVRELGAIKDSIKVLEARADELSATIKEYAIGSDSYMFETAAYSVKVTEVAGRRTLDVPAYEKATGVKADGYYKVGKPSVRLEVTAKTSG